MPRSATPSDVFRAIAEPRRREIIELLGRGGASPVGSIVRAVRLPQPAVSKHLGVLREAGVVSVSRRGRERLYELSGRELRTVHDWTRMFERFWDHQLDRIKDRAETRAGQQTPPHQTQE